MVRQQLIDWREGRGWSRAQLAQKVGVDAKTVRRWENGQVRPLLTHRIALAQVFDFSLDDVNRAVNGDTLTRHHVSQDLGAWVGNSERG